MNISTKVYDLCGQLQLDEHKDYNYIVKDGDIESSITDILEGAYKNNSLIYIAITMDRAIALEEEGYIYETPDGDSVLCPFLNGENIDKFLFDHTGKRMSIYIKVAEIGVGF
jgi:hypothetical protein